MSCSHVPRFRFFRLRERERERLWKFLDRYSTNIGKIVHGLENFWYNQFTWTRFVYKGWRVCVRFVTRAIKRRKQFNQSWVAGSS